MRAVCWIVLAWAGLVWAGSGADRPPFTLTDDLGVKVEIKAYPQRIVSLAPSNTEILYALGLGDRVVGVTEFCDYPPEAKKKEKVGGYNTLSLEKIVSLKPDLVLAARGNPAQTIEGLRALGVKVYGIDAQTVEQTLRAIETVGRMIGVDAGPIVAPLRRRVEQVVEGTKGIPPDRRPRVLWGGWEPPIYAAGPGTIIGDVIRLAGGVNVADDAPTAWPQYSLEMIVAKDPEVLITGYLPNSGKVEEALERARRDLKGRDGWRSVSAVKAGRIYYLETDLLGRTGPRIVDALERMAQYLRFGL